MSRDNDNVWKRFCSVCGAALRADGKLIKRGHSCPQSVLDEIAAEVDDKDRIALVEIGINQEDVEDLDFYGLEDGDPL